MKRSLLWLLASLLPVSGFSQTNAAAEAARDWRQQNERVIVDEFIELLSIPNVSRDEKEWATPPFRPTLRSQTIERGGQVLPLPTAGRRFDPDSRLYARSAGDDKAPIIAMMAAVDAIRAAGLKMKSNITFAFDGEEETGSPNLEKMLAANKDLFSADVGLMCDGPLHQTRR